MFVGTCSGVTSAGMVISSAFSGTSSGNSSLTSDRIRDVLPTPWSPTSRIRTCRLCDTDQATIVLCHCVCVCVSEDEFNKLTRDLATFADPNRK